MNISNRFYYFGGLDAKEGPSIPWVKRERRAASGCMHRVEPGRNLKSTDLVIGKLSRSVSHNSRRLVHRVAVAAVRCAPHDAEHLNRGQSDSRWCVCIFWIFNIPRLISMILSASGIRKLTTSSLKPPQDADILCSRPLLLFASDDWEQDSHPYVLHRSIVWD
jgi:hypothetical protein